MDTELISTLVQNIGNVGCLSDECDETEFNIFVMKGPDYNIMMFATFSGFTVPYGTGGKCTITMP